MGSISHSVRQVAQGVERIDFAGSIDLEVAEPFKQALFERLETTDVLLVGMQGVVFMDSSGLAALQAALLRARSRGKALHLISPSRLVEKLLHLVGWGPVYRSEEEFLAA
jgi:anti-sigma B factor antagonist